MGFIFILLARLLGIFLLLMFIRAIISWIPGIDPYNPIVQTLDQFIEPVLAPIRQYVPPMGGLDLSYMVALIVIIVLQRTLLILGSSL